MAFLSRAATPDFTAKYHGLLKKLDKAGAVFKSTTTACCSLLLLLVCAVAQLSAQQYQQTNLVSDVPGMAASTDANLVNPWGLVSSSTSPWWVSDNGTGLSTLYNGAGVKQSLTVTVAKPPMDPDPATPTGVVFNGSSDFQLVSGVPTTAARFIFVTEDGTVSGWNPSVNPANSFLKVDNSGLAVYKGATIAQAGGVNFLYVANFFSGSVDVFNTNFAPASLPSGAFTDPNIPAGFAPFNVQNIGGNIFVAFAKQDPDKHDEVAGRKLGFVDAFDANGTLLQRFDNGPWMNAPWGLALAPASGFGKASGEVLVGMFGSGQVATFDAATGEFEGLLRGRRGRPIEIDGLWALRFGNGAGAGPATTLFFTAGIDDEAHGLFGTITPVPKRDDDDDDDDDQVKN
ncbi:MAG: TIGR03118 family protein [Acidobacteriota bacterium]